MTEDLLHNRGLENRGNSLRIDLSFLGFEDVEAIDWVDMWAVSTRFSSMPKFSVTLSSSVRFAQLSMRFKHPRAVSQAGADLSNSCCSTMAAAKLNFRSLGFLVSVCDKELKERKTVSITVSISPMDMRLAGTL